MKKLFIKALLVFGLIVVGASNDFYHPTKEDLVVSEIAFDVYYEDDLIKGEH